MRLFAASIITTTVIFAATEPARTQTSASCDRACLIRTADAYFAAMAAHDPKKAPLAPTVRFTEQAKVLTVGDGLWKSMTKGPTTFKIYVPDPVSQQIGGIAMVESGGVATELALRLKVQNGTITEAEHLMAAITSPNQLGNLDKPRPGLLSAVPAADRLPREILLLFAHGYYDALEQSDGHAVPFADDCVRRENGMQTAGPRASGAPAAPSPGRGGGLPGADGPPQLCGPQLDTRTMSYIDSLDLRRVRIADPENGLVFGLSMFRHSMKDKTITILNPDGTKGQRAVTFDPFDLEAAHIIKVQGHKIHDIEAMGFMLPLYSKNGWSDFVR